MFLLAAAGFDAPAQTAVAARPSAASQPHASTPPDPTELVRLTASRNEDLLEALSAFRYERYREIRWLDGEGRVKSSGSTLHGVVISHGAPYSRLLAEDGRRLEGGETSGLANCAW